MLVLAVAWTALDRFTLEGIVLDNGAKFGWVSAIYPKVRSAARFCLLYLSPQNTPLVNLWLSFSSPEIVVPFKNSQDLQWDLVPIYQHTRPFLPTCYISLYLPTYQPLPSQLYKPCTICLTPVFYIVKHFSKCSTYLLLLLPIHQLTCCMNLIQIPTILPVCMNFIKQHRLMSFVRFCLSWQTIFV